MCIRDRFAVLAIPTARLVQAIVPTHPWTDETITLEVPAHGSLVLRLVDDTGALVLNPTLVTLDPQQSDSVKIEGQRSVQALSKNGVARFEQVELGLELKATVRIPGHQALSTAIVGPTSAGEEVSATIQCGPQTALLVARLLDPQGAPLAS